MGAIRDLLVHLDNSSQGRMRMAIATDLARRHAAHLTGLYIVDIPPITMLSGDPSDIFDMNVFDEMMGRLRDAARKDASAVESRFREALRKDDIEGEWRLVEGDSAETVSLHARYVDLVVVGQADPNTSPLGSGPEIAPSTLLGSGRPTLVIPFGDRFQRLGDKVLVGWKSSREAARAVNDAIPLLSEAASVVVLSINPKDGTAGDGDLPAADIAHHLARHDIRAEAAHTVSRDVSEADVLLNYAADIGADWIVAGGYGHSRLREFAFGGVTRQLLETMTVPVLFSH